jgi:hypothetical protein
MSTEALATIRRFIKPEGLRSKHPWVLAIVLGLLWAGIRMLFSHLQTSLEMQLTDSGLALFWWLIVLAYFIADLLMLLVGLYFIGRPMPEGVPFWHFSLDIATFVFLMHASYTCLDHLIYVQLSAIGLQYSYLVFGIAATLWTAAVLLRLHSLEKRLSRDPNAMRTKRGQTEVTPISD